MRFCERYLRGGRRLSRCKRRLPLLFFLSLVAAMVCTTPFSLYRGWPVTVVAGVVALAGFAVRWEASKCTSHHPLDRAAAGGIYSVVRFPGYLADLLLICSVSVSAGMVWYLFFIVPVSLMVLGRIMAFEEHAAAGRYGALYLQWCRGTEALWPRVIGWRPSRSRTDFVSLVRAQLRPAMLWAAACLGVSLLKNYRMDFAVRADLLWLALLLLAGALRILLPKAGKER